MSERKIRKMVGLFTILAFSVSSPQTLAASNVKSIDFTNSDQNSILKITADGPVTVEKQENIQDNQIILELKGAKLSKTALRKIDTSSFKSNVKLISPYEVAGQADTARIVVQLAANSSAELTQNDGVISLSVPVSPSAVSGSNPASSPDTATTSADANLTQPLNETQKSLDNALEARSTGRFTGKPINLQVRDADVNDVLRLISDASGFNIVVGQDVQGKLTLALTEVPWDQALDVVLRTLKLGAERNNNVLRVVTLTELTNEKNQELAAKRAALAAAPTVTKVFSVSYADPNELATTLATLGGDGTGSGASAGSTSGSSSGSSSPSSSSTSGTLRIQVDRRTNSLIVKDTPENLEKIGKLIQLMDTQTPQVLIEAKIIEASDGFAKTLGGSIGIGSSTARAPYFASFAGANPIDGLIGSPGVFANGTSISGSSAGGGTFGFSPSLSFLPGSPRLNAVLNFAESDNMVKVISSPKLVVLNRQAATVVSSTPVAMVVNTTSNGVVSSSLTVQPANISLGVTPTVTAEGSVQMLLALQRGVPTTISAGGQTGQSVADRTLNTRVLVESGSTLVIGGIYTMQTSQTTSGFPFLRKIPILGWLFGNESESTTRAEIFFFITPRILNTKEAGMGSA